MRAAATTRFQTCQVYLIYGLWDARATDSSYSYCAYTITYLHIHTANDTKQSDYYTLWSREQPGPRSSDRINVAVVFFFTSYSYRNLKNRTEILSSQLQPSPLKSYTSPIDCCLLIVHRRSLHTFFDLFFFTNSYVKFSSTIRYNHPTEYM